MKKPRVIVIFGVPGAGKSLQASLLANKFDFFHLEASRWFEKRLRDPESKNDPVFKKEKKLYLEGKLLTPSFVVQSIKKEVKKVAGAGWDLVLSGSPRTLYEAERLVPYLANLYGRDSLAFVLLDVPEAVSLKRNGGRLVCSVCGTAPINYSLNKPCPVCGGKLLPRKLDKSAVARVRLEEYKNRTEPIFAYLKKEGFKIVNIDGRSLPYEVSAAITKKIKLS